MRNSETSLRCSENLPDLLLQGYFSVRSGNKDHLMTGVWPFHHLENFSLSSKQGAPSNVKGAISKQRDDATLQTCRSTDFRRKPRLLCDPVLPVEDMFVVGKMKPKTRRVYKSSFVMFGTVGDAEAWEATNIFHVAPSFS